MSRLAYKAARMIGAKWIFLWIGASVFPVVPYTLTLFQGALADSPQAYLIWIPVLAFSWAVWMLFSASGGVRNSSRETALGLLIALLSGFTLVAGGTIWKHEFIVHDLAFLVWPFWASGLLMLLAGWRVAKSILKPMAYLVLAWPPLYAWILSILDPFLESFTNNMVSMWGHAYRWIHLGEEPGYFFVHSAGAWVLVSITKACSGSDSVLAALALFPISLVLFEASFLKKLLLVLAGCVLSVIFNMIRICLIFLALHLFGVWFAIDILHPVLGSIFFFTIIGFLLMIGSRRTMEIARISSEQAVLPGMLRLYLTGILGIVMTLLLVPLYSWSAGSVLFPIPIQSDHLSTLLPSFASPSRFRVIQGKGYLQTEYTSEGHSLCNVRIAWSGNVKFTSSSLILNGMRARQSYVSQHNLMIRPGIQGKTYDLYRVGKSRPYLLTFSQRTVFMISYVFQFERRELLIDINSPRFILKQKTVNALKNTEDLENSLVRNSRIFDEYLNFKRQWIDALLSGSTGQSSH